MKKFLRTILKSNKGQYFITGFLMKDVILKMKIWGSLDAAFERR